MNNWEDLVESTLDAVCLRAEKKELIIEVTCAWKENDRRRIIASGVDDFVLNEMRFSNTFDRVTYFSSTDFPERIAEIERYLFLLMRDREPSQTDLEWPVLKEKSNQVADGSLGLLVVEPVYGASIMILASDIRLESFGVP